MSKDSQRRSRQRQSRRRQRGGRRNSLRRPLTVVLYAAFIGLLLASYVAPAQQILSLNNEIPTLKKNLSETRSHNAEQQRTVEALKTPEGIEKAARQRYGMVEPGEKVYIIPKD